MTRKVIYVSVGRLTDKMVRDCHIDHVIGKGVTVEYWDVVSLLREEHSERHATTPTYLRVLRTFGEVKSLIRQPENRDAHYVMLITYTGRFVRIFRLLSKHNCRMSTFVWGTLPRDSAYKWRKIAAWLRTPSRLALELFNRAKASGLRRLKLVQPFESVFAAGGVAMARNNFAARIVPINYFDYDEYLKTRAANSRRLVGGRYAVFLDSNLPYHSDLGLSGDSRLDPDSYYGSLNRFFRLLEQQYEISVVIAAHPRSDYNSATYEGRHSCRLVTAELVKDAEFVLAHASTAISFAILNAKPLIFIYTSSMVAAYERWMIREMRVFADYLDAPIYNVDLVDVREVRVKQVNLHHYERYKYDFLTSRQSENTLSREILCRELVA